MNLRLKREKSFKRKYWFKSLEQWTVDTGPVFTITIDTNH
jgi:hypothetical protein